MYLLLSSPLSFCYLFYEMQCFILFILLSLCKALCRSRLVQPSASKCRISVQIWTWLLIAVMVQLVLLQFANTARVLEKGMKSWEPCVAPKVKTIMATGACCKVLVVEKTLHPSLSSHEVWFMFFYGSVRLGWVFSFKPGQGYPCSTLETNLDEVFSITLHLSDVSSFIWTNACMQFVPEDSEEAVDPNTRSGRDFASKSTFSHSQVCVYKCLRFIFYRCFIRSKGCPETWKTKIWPF